MIAARFLPLLLLAAAPVSAQGLTVRTGETWIFTVIRGQPANARRVDAPTKARKGEVQVSVRAMMGTTMTIRSNNPVAFTFNATLLGKTGPVAVRTCTLPANGRPAFESWPPPSTGVRLSDFKPATSGTC